MKLPERHLKKIIVLGVEISPELGFHIKCEIYLVTICFLYFGFLILNEKKLF